MSFSCPERRVQRSANPIEALACWLEATRRRAALPSVALADGSGLLLAGAGPSRDCDELAAWAPLLDPSSGASVECPPALRSVKLQGADVYVCAPGLLEDLSEAAAGCARILGLESRH